jgi:hypothetical protein
MRHALRFFILLSACLVLDSCSGTNGKGNASSGATESLGAAPAEIRYDSYCNEQYGFCIDYPVEILLPQGESDSGDGQAFKSKDGENTLLVYRDLRDNSDPDGNFTIQQAFQEDIKIYPERSNREVTYKKEGENFYVVSGYNNGKIFYQKTILSDGKLVTCLLEYSESEKERYNKIAEYIFSTFK